MKPFSFQCRGFTLLELLVAMGIFALLSVMAYSGLDSVLDTRQRTEQDAARLTQLQKTMLNIRRDIEQAVSRSIRDEYGDKRAALMVSDANDITLELTRSGYRNPAGTKRSSLQRVGYKVEDGILYRLRWPVLDRAQDTQAMQATLLENIRAITVRVLDHTNEWQNFWPPLASGASTASPVLPKALEVTFELEDWGKVTRLLPLPQG